MKCAASSSRSAALCVRFLVSFATILAAAISLSCGSGVSKTPPFSGNTQVTVMLSSTANDQLSEFGLVLNSISLTSQTGKVVNLLNQPQGAEFITINGGAIPLVTANVPQDIYTSAAVTIGSAQFTCLTLDSSGGIATSIYAYGQTPQANVTVNLPSPITVTGNSLGISLNLQVSSSASFPSSCYVPGNVTYAITPTFNVSPIAFSSNPTNPANGKISGQSGEIATIGTDGESFTLSLPVVDETCPCVQPAPPTVKVNGSTVYQGLGSFSGLAVGTLIDMDAAVQPDGSLLASRIAAYDPAAQNVMTGPLLFVDTLVPTFNSLGRQQNGQVYSVQPQSLGIYSFSAGTSFQLSGQFANVASLPFAASFNASNMVAGQNIAVFSQAITDYYGGQYTAATTMTLTPQTINASVVSATSLGNFTDYTVSLAQYDLFPTLAVQPGQTTLLSNPSQVEVYVDSNTQLLNMQNLASGGTFRFYGLIFNDNGTLRMDCAQVNDGVPFTPPSSANTHFETGQARTIQRLNRPGLPELITTVTRSR